jgi:hypothetical protein
MIISVTALRWIPQYWALKWRTGFMWLRIRRDSIPQLIFGIFKWKEVFEQAINISCVKKSTHIPLISVTAQLLTD